MNFSKWLSGYSPIKGRLSFKLHILQKMCIHKWAELLISTISHLLAARAQARHSSKLDVLDV